jgi:hypothetical protein
VTAPLAGFSARPVFDDWQQPEYARVLHFYVGAPLGLDYEDLFRPPNQVLTFLHRSRNRYNRIDMASEEFGGTEQPSS